VPANIGVVHCGIDLMATGVDWMSLSVLDRSCLPGIYGLWSGMHGRRCRLDAVRTVGLGLSIISTERPASGLVEDIALDRVSAVLGRFIGVVVSMVRLAGARLVLPLLLLRLGRGPSSVRIGHVPR
jgi:hypothetical protein